MKCVAIILYHRCPSGLDSTIAVTTRWPVNLHLKTTSSTCCIHKGDPPCPFVPVRTDKKKSFSILRQASASSTYSSCWIRNAPCPCGPPACQEVGYRPASGLRATNLSPRSRCTRECFHGIHTGTWSYPRAGNKLYLKGVSRRSPYVIIFSLQQGAARPSSGKTPTTYNILPEKKHHTQIIISHVMFEK